MNYSYFAEEWYGNCGACGTELFAPTKLEYLYQYDLHTHSDKCLGGW